MVFKNYELEKGLLEEPFYVSEITESVERRLDEGKALREVVPREAHGQWEAASDRPDAVDMVIEADRGRIEKLVPLRHGRMMLSPFTFLRGSAGIMAYDLSSTPRTGLEVQMCGDCHLSNFRLMATPERNLIFDYNDFDETIPGPWEWDLKRLVASVHVAYRLNGISEKECKALAMTCARAYRKIMRRAAGMRWLDIWYAGFDFDTLLAYSTDPEVVRRLKVTREQALRTVQEHVVPKLTEEVDGHRRIVDQPPVIQHFPNPGLKREMKDLLAKYRETMHHEKRILLDRYQLEDMALKVVGVGSVGTVCGILLMRGKENDWLMLQAKEAKPSVCEPFVRKSEFKNHGERVVCGQRIIQSASDIFLGWTRLKERDYYIRQLKDMKFKAVIESQPFEVAREYVKACAWVLAKGHARSGDPAMIAGYMGKSDTFDRAMAEFARRYADQTVADHRALVEAHRSGRIEVQEVL